MWNENQSLIREAYNAFSVMKVMLHYIFSQCCSLSANHHLIFESYFLGFFYESKKRPKNGLFGRQETRLHHVEHKNIAVCSEIL